MHELAGKKILILRTDRLGDVILSTPVASAIKKRFPKSKITFLVRQYTQQLVENCADIDEAISIETFFNDKQKLSIQKLARFLRRQQFDMAIHLFPRPGLALATFLARIPVRVGMGYRFYSLLFNRRQYEHRKNAVFHEVEYNLRLLNPVEIFEKKAAFDFRLDQNAREKIDRIFKSSGICETQQIVILHPGSGGSSRNWPLSNFARLAQKLIEEKNALIIFTGTAEEKPETDWLAAKAGMKPMSLAGRLNLIELAALLKRADIFVANSTGPLHLAVAMGTEVVAFYPPITACRPERWGPYGRRNDVLMSREAECYDCRNAKTNLVCACMEKISVQEAYEKVCEKLVSARIPS
ncbi:MAG: glycosyltransferase family 9 protein [bacterium]